MSQEKYLLVLEKLAIDKLLMIKMNNYVLIYLLKNGRNIHFSKGQKSTEGNFDPIDGHHTSASILSQVAIRSQWKQL